MIFVLLALHLTATAPHPQAPAFPTDLAQPQSDLYLDQLRRRVESVWKYPNGSDNLQATVKFDLNRSGYVSDVVITKSSGRDDFDASVLQAVKSATPFPPIPDDLMRKAEGRKVEMTFSRKPDKPALLKKPKPRSPAPRQSPNKQTPGVQI
jgi:TonB family protein